MNSIARAERIPYILNHCRTIAVVGLSPKPHRASFDVSRYMQAAGYRIIPINPNATQVLGEKAYATLQEAAQHEKIDLVNCFRNSEDIPPIVDAAIAIGAKAVWMQLGVSNAAAAARAEAADLLVVQDHCIKIDHRVLLSSGLLPSPSAPPGMPSR
ncbi:MAG: CoA-binding protein [Polaromonas sp.]